MEAIPVTTRFIVGAELARKAGEVKPTSSYAVRPEGYQNRIILIDIIYCASLRLRSRRQSYHP
jgi:hypothetical protein